MKNLVEKIESAILQVIDRYPSQYINCKNSKGEDVKIRVSNHNSNPSRMGDLDISLVVKVEDNQECDDDVVTAFCINKKNFRNIPNQHWLDSEGNFEEHFFDLEEMLDFYDIKY